jgi:sugar phosphate isomerase/epimerase
MILKNTHPLIVLLALGVLLAVNARADFHDHLGMQLWSLRAQIQTNGLPASLDLIKGWGITEVESISVAGMTAEQVRAELDKRGLKAVSAHVSYDQMAKDLPAVIRDVKALGAQVAICPWIPHEGAFDAALMRRVADDFNKWGAAFRAEGIRFGYHPHGYEFVPNGTVGETLLDDLIRATKPENVCYEMDVFWAVHGGGDPVKLLKKYSTRWVALHVKDMRKGALIGLPKPESAPDTDNVAVGAGQIDWKAVLGTAEKIGVTYYIIEDETPTPLQCIPASLAYLRALKL